MPRKLTLEEFVEKAIEIHGGKYDYSKVVYKGNNKTPVEIICLKPKHGSFNQTPSNHLSGKGCKKCAIEERAKKKLEKAREEFVEEARKIHGNKYDYRKVVYKGSKTLVEIICLKHGPFYQTPSNHLNGHGCPFCTKYSNIGKLIEIVASIGLSLSTLAPSQRYAIILKSGLLNSRESYIKQAYEYLMDGIITPVESMIDKFRRKPATEENQESQESQEDYNQYDDEIERIDTKPIQRLVIF
jgi:hypothetical protein